ncbi:amidohydrolase family protein [Microvirga puerhi]|uniref:Amidohydrolase family protein n=1 Tax=Microvirga puerhi TaxID=2876078 RepID=A0ABS7VI73_9HYPH|nr:amidohydrolase family protein [Microvirga puerhi]MBZ6074851.1 amidohydrolase family protein [Microvirga puerhi]
MRIDSHQHFWLMRNRIGQWPPPKLAAIHRDFLPADLEPLLAANGIDGTVLVQSLSSLDDTEFMLQLADQHAFILGVVGWVDLKKEEAPAQITRLAAHPKLKSLRPMLQDIADIGWIDDPALNPAIAAMKRHQICFDALVMPPHLRALTAFAKRHPNLPIVIDHGAKPLIASGHMHDWRSDMARLAALPHVHCKLSGLLTEAGQRPEAAALRPYVETLFDLFGADRILWGSDWPVLRLAGEYGDWLAMCMDFVPAEYHEAVFGLNALAFYRLGENRQRYQDRAMRC